MRRLTHRDFDRLSNFLLDLYQFRDHETFVAHTLQALHHLIPCERVTYNEMDMAKQTVYAKSTLNDPRIRQLSSRFTALMHQHPSVRHVQADRSREREALRISDFLTNRQFQNLPLYREYFRHLDTTHQLAVNIDGSADLFINLAFNRHTRDFSDEEHAVLTLLRPHLALAHRNASTASHVMKNLSGLTTAVTAIGAAAVQVDQHGRISWMTDNAEELLRTYCQTTSAEPLPPMIREWFRVQSAIWLDQTTPLTSPQSLTLHHHQGALTLSLGLGALLNLLPAYWMISFGLYAVIFFQTDQGEELLEHAVGLHHEVEKLGALLQFLEQRARKPGSALTATCRVLRETDKAPSALIRRLAWVLHGVSVKAHPLIHLVFNALCPWDLFFAFRLQQFQQRIQNLLPLWLDCLAEVEAASALATFAYLHPSYAWPTPSRTEALTATGLGHPLIPSQHRVTNDISFARRGTIYLVTVQTCRVRAPSSGRSGSTSASRKPRRRSAHRLLHGPGAVLPAAFA